MARVRELLVGLGPSLHRSSYSLVAAIRLAHVIGQDRVLVDDIGVEQREVDIARPPRLAERSKVLSVPGFDETTKVVRVPVRHRVLHAGLATAD